jgi:aminotransferase EvaB
MTIPLNDLRRQTESLADELKPIISSVVDGGQYLFGTHVTAFEKSFAEYCGVRHCITVANGTEALELALRALNCGPESKVVTVANAGMYSAAATVSVGAKPLFVDVDTKTMTMAADAFARSIEQSVKAVIVTHLYGQLAEIEQLAVIAREHGLAVIEDCAQAHGARRNGQCAGTLGDFGCYSFYPTKNLGCLGDGGAIITNSDAHAGALRELRQYGWQMKYHAARPQGRNSRMDEIQAAVLRIKLPKLDLWNERRRAIVRRYRDAAGEAITFPNVDGLDHVAHLCVIRSAQRDLLRQWLAADGIASDIHYPIPDHRQPALRHVLPPDLSLPVSDQAAREILTLPCFPELTEAEIDQVCASLTRFCENVVSRQSATAAS